MLTEMAGLGFKYVELSHGIRITLVPGILKAVEEGVIKVASTHNFCPLPTGIVQAAPNLFEPSAADSRELDQWQRHTKRSLDFAAQVKSRVLVCHLGSVHFFWFNPARAVKQFSKNNPAAKIPDDPAYRAVLTKATARLRKRMGPYWERTQQSVRGVFEHAKQKGILLGFENREKFEELPVDADYADFMASMPADAPVGYWHDTGHADIKQTMGMLNHEEHLKKLAPRLIGFHVHDVSAQGQDHQPVGSGHIDFKMISSFWRPEHLLVLEFGPRLTVDDVRVSKERVEALIADLG